MQYDVAAKVLIEKCRNEILRHLFGLSVTKSELIEEMPQETVSVRRADFAVRVTTEDDDPFMAVLEIQSHWKDEMPLRLLEYRTRYLLKYKLPTISLLLLLRPSAKAVGSYSDNEVDYRYRFVPIYELEAGDILDRGTLCLYPLIPLMKGGPEAITQAEDLLIRSGLPSDDKGDMLTSMALLTGLVSKELSTALIQRRRNIMIESAAYEIIKNEGLEAGIQQGLEKGIQQGIQQGLEKGIQQGLEKGLEKGIQQGIQQGKIQEARESILDYLEARFGGIPRDVMRAVDAVENLDRLKQLRLASAKVDTMDAFRTIMNQA